MIVVPHSAQSLAAFHWVVKFSHVGVGGCSKRIPKSSMISIPVMVVHILWRSRAPTDSLPLRASCVIHELSGCGVMPATCTDLEAMSINNRM